MSQKSENRTQEIITWYHYNKNLIPKENLVKRLDFQQKAIDCLLELIVHLLEDIDPLEHKAGQRSKTLWLPKGMKVNGDVRKLE